MTTERDIAVVLNEHADYETDWETASIPIRCTCGALLHTSEDSHAGDMAALAAHQAAMVMAHLREQGEEEPGIYSNLRRYIITTDWEEQP